MLDSSCLFYFTWPCVSSGSDGLFLSPLSDMSPATSDCLEQPYFSGFLFFSFPIIIACVLNFWVLLFSFDFFTIMCLKKNQNAPRPSEHPLVMGEKCQNV